MTKELIYSENSEKENKQVVEELEQTIIECRKYALASISHFLDLIKVDKEIINTIKKIKIIIDYDLVSDDIEQSLDNYIAIHESFYNNIIINGRVLIKKYNIYNEKNNIDNLYKYLTFVLIHEYLHTFRDFIFKDEIIEKSNKEKYLDYSYKYESIIGQDHDYSKKVLSIVEDKDVYRILIYNYSECIFEELFISKYFVDYLDSFDLLHKNNLSITNFMKLFKISDEFKTYSVDYERRITNVCKINNGIYKGIEEYLVDCFAEIIIEHRDESKYNIEVVETLKELSTSSLDNNALGFSIISKMSIEDIRWFFTSYMEDEYNDRLKNVLKDNYYEIIDTMNQIYNLYLNDKNTEDEFNVCLKLINQE